MAFSSFKILIIALVLAVIGLFLLPRLSVQLNPSPSAATINVSYSWPNASPYNVEQQITSVLESGFSTIRGLEKVNSQSSKGFGRIGLNFNEHVSLDMARFEVSSIIRQLYKNIPAQASYPVITLNKPEEEDQVEFLSYSITAPQTPFEIQETVKTQIEPLLGAVKGVDKIEIFGANPKEWVIDYNPDLLRSLSITKQEMLDALQHYFERNSLGEVNYKNRILTLTMEPGSQNLHWDIPIKKVGSSIVYLNEIASIKEQEQESTRYYRVNGLNAITIGVYAEKAVNTISLANTVDKELKYLKNQLPGKYQITKIYDSTQYLQKELSTIYKRSIYTVVLLLLFVFLVSRSFRYLFIIILSVIANLSVAFMLYYYFQIETQLYSLAGITISLGLIMDNSIVMIDHIRNQGNTKVFVPILASTLTTMGALSIIYFLDEQYKLNLIDFAWVIIINLFVSLFVALFLIPALIDKIHLKKETNTQFSKKWSAKFYRIYQSFVVFTVRYKKLFILIIILAFGLPLFMLPQKLEKSDTFLEKAYNNTIGNDWYRENLRRQIDKYLGGTFRLFSYYVFENTFYGDNEETKLHVIAAMEKGATIHQMNEAYLQIEDYLLSFDEIEKFTTNIYSGSYADMEITFKEPYNEGSFPYTLKNRLIRKALDLGGMAWNIYGVGKGYSSGGGANEPINFRLEAKGYNYDELNFWADSLKLNLEEHPRVRNVVIRENSIRKIKRSSEYVLDLDKERLAMLEVTPLKVYQDLKSLTLSKYKDLSLIVKGKYTPIRFESSHSQDFDIWQIKNGILGNKDIEFYNLKQTATVAKQPEDENIYKENQEYIRLIEFQYTGSQKFGNKFLNRTLKQIRTQLPLGYSFKRSKLHGNFQTDSKSNYGLLLLLILAVIYTICAILFESFKQPFIILGIIPISFIGVFLTFYLFDFNFDQGGMASFVLLSGITVNASIYILDEFNKMKTRFPKKTVISMYIEAYRYKIFPILLTIVSTILGFVPFVVGGQNDVFWFALGAGTIGGLVFSLIGILIFLPIFSINRKTMELPAGKGKKA